MRTLDDALEITQKKKSFYPEPKITLTSGETTYTIEVDRIKKLTHVEEPWQVNAKDVILDNSDNYFTDLDLKGYDAVISYGMKTSSGKKYSDTSPMKVIGQQLNSVPGALTCELIMVGIPDLMDEDEASAVYEPTVDDADTVKDLLTEIAEATLACFSHCQAYEIVFDSEDSLIDSYQPQDSFRIYVGGSRLAAFKRLLERTGCVHRFEDDGKIHIFVPTIEGTDYDYEYSLESGHTFFSRAYRKTLVIPNYVVVQSEKDDDPFYTGYATDATSYALLPIRHYVTGTLQEGEATSLAEALIARFKLNSEMGAAEVPMNCGAELYDYVKVSDEFREDNYRVGNIGGITRYYQPGKYQMRFNFGDPPSEAYIKDLTQSIKRTTGWELDKLTVKDAYIEHLLVDSIDAVWIDPEGNIDLDKIGDTLDNLPDGEVYARVKTLHLDAGNIKLDENVLYSTGYDPNTKRRTFVTTPTTPYDVGDLWLDASTVKRCTTARATGAYQAGDWTATTLDAIAEGTTYQRVLGTHISAGKIQLFDETVVGATFTLDKVNDGSTYQRLLATDISSGHIKLTSYASFSGKWYSASGVSISADSGINIWGTNNALTTRATETGTIQCYVGSDGYLYAGAGAVWLNSGGIIINSQTATTLIRWKYGGNYASAYLDASNNFWIGITGGITRSPEIVPDQAGTENLGSSSVRWKGVYGGPVLDTTGETVEGGLKYETVGDNNLAIYSSGAWRTNG